MADGVETKVGTVYLSISGPISPASKKSSDHGPVLLRAAGPFYLGLSSRNRQVSSKIKSLWRTAGRRLGLVMKPSARPFPPDESVIAPPPRIGWEDCSFRCGQVGYEQIFLPFLGF